MYVVVKDGGINNVATRQTRKFVLIKTQTLKTQW